MNQQFIKNLYLRYSREIVYYNGDYYWSQYRLPSNNVNKLDIISNKSVERAIRLGLLTHKGVVYVADEAKIRQYLRDNPLTKYDSWYNKPIGIQNEQTK